MGEVFDISWLANGDGGLICTVHQDLFNFWNSSQPGSVTVQELIDALPSVVPSNTILDQHYFNDDGAGGITPVWDSRATPRFQGVDNAVFLGKVVAKTSDPNPTQNVDWLHLVKVSGDIADEVYRILTVGGVPPTSVSLLSLSCIAGASEVDPADGCAYTFLFSVCRWHDGGYLHQICFSVLALWRILGFRVILHVFVYLSRSLIVLTRGR